MKPHTVAAKAAAYLAASAEFLAHGYSVLSDVRVKDIALNGTALRGTQAVDLLVCDGNRVLIGIACRPAAAVSFNRNMLGLPYVQLPQVDSALPLDPEDGGWMDYPSEACLEQLLQNIMTRLSRMLPQARPPARTGKSLASYRKCAAGGSASGDHKPAGKQYTVNPVPPEQVMGRKPLNAHQLYKQMIKKQLLHEDFTPTLYGSAHGLFLRCQTGPFGDVFQELLTVPDAVPELRAVLDWRPGRADHGKLPLAERCRRISRQSAIIGTSPLAAVSDLLNMPVELLFERRPEDLQQLQSTLARSSFLLGGDQTSAAGPLYRDVLRTIQSLRRCIPDDPMLDDQRSRQLRRACETLLLLLSDVFLNTVGSAAEIPQKGPYPQKECLEKRLTKVHRYALFQSFGMSLADYYQALSQLSGCPYPNWVYQTRIRRLVEHTGKPETNYNLRFLASYCQLCREDAAVDDWEETFPLLLDLIVTPICAVKP